MGGACWRKVYVSTFLVCFGLCLYLCWFQCCFSDLLLHAVFVEDVGKHLFTLLMFFTLL